MVLGRPVLGLMQPKHANSALALGIDEFSRMLCPAGLLINKSVLMSNGLAEAGAVIEPNAITVAISVFFIIGSPKKVKSVIALV